MDILLIDLDMMASKRHLYPNLALMKLSAWHKPQGDTILSVNFLLAQPDKIYVSCVFKEFAYLLDTLPFDNIQHGGSGFLNWTTTLTKEVEHIYPDYELYNCQIAMGFTSRGCLRKCPFCIVPDKEGKPQAWTTIYEFWHGQKQLILLDPNLLAAPNWKQTLQDLAKEQVPVNMDQGLDIRLLDEEMAYWLAKINHNGQLHFAWDLVPAESSVRRGLQILERAGIPPRRCMFYVLIGFNTTPEEDLYRVEALRSLGADPFVMPFVRNDYTKRFTRWVNHKAIFGSVAWQDYNIRYSKDNSGLSLF